LDDNSLLHFEARVQVERPQTPTIWIDTSIVIKLWKIGRGENIPQQDVKRVRRLAEVVGQKVRERKLLCLETHQRTEFPGRAELDILKEFRGLTFGVDLRSELTVREFQTEVAMRAFLAGEREVRLPLRVFFDGAPEAQIEQVVRSGWLITALMPTAEELVAHRAEKKTELRGGLEALRKKLVAEGVTYEAQLEAERSGLLKAGIALFDRWVEALSSGEQPSVWDMLGSTALASPMRAWQELGGPPRLLGRFLTSRYLHALPLPKIETQLFARLVTGNEVIQSGDEGDVGHLSLVLPVARFVVTDKAMERRVKELGLDREWGAEVYSLSSSEALLARLEGL
jgi:hypothetical protein